MQALLVFWKLATVLKQRYLEQSQTWNQQYLLKALELCNKVDLNYRMSKNQRLLVEITLNANLWR